MENTEELFLLVFTDDQLPACDEAFWDLGLARIAAAQLSTTNGRSITLLQDHGAYEREVQVFPA